MTLNNLKSLLTFFQLLLSASDNVSITVELSKLFSGSQMYDGVRLLTQEQSLVNTEAKDLCLEFFCCGACYQLQCHPS